MNRLKILAYCDGSYSPKTGGGWGFIYYYYTSFNVRLSWSKCGGDKKANHQRMELNAIYECLDCLPFNSDVVIYGDNEYALKGICSIQRAKPVKLLLDFNKKPNFSGWIAGWIKNGWKTSKGEDVKNKDLWIKIIDRCSTLLTNGTTLSFQWVKGHSGVEGNEMADILAKKGAKKN